MTLLSNFSNEIGRLTFSAEVCAFLHDGVVMSNKGFGWKPVKRVKAGVDPVEAFQEAKRNQEALYKFVPTLKLYRETIMSLGLDQASMLHYAIKALGDDYDGIWSHCQDNCFPAVDLTVDEIRDISSLYQLALRDLSRVKETLLRGSLAENPALKATFVWRDYDKH